jgi:hypothetical protein
VVAMNLHRRSCGVRRTFFLILALLMQFGQQLHPSKLLQLMQPQVPGLSTGFVGSPPVARVGVLAHRVRVSNIGRLPSRATLTTTHSTEERALTGSQQTSLR